jgi:sialidase-1
VQDRESGRIWLLFCKNRRDGDEQMICEGKAPREVWKCYSDDDGQSWSDPVEITASVKPAEWSWYATGPCHGIQLTSGRLIIPCDHIVLKDYKRHDPYYSHVIYSDDAGETWNIGGSTSEGTNESCIEELSDGLLYFNCRNKYRLDDGGNYRGIAFSTDGGERFSPIVHDVALPEPVCQASVLAYRLPGETVGNADSPRGAPASAAAPDAPDNGTRILFSNPAARSGLSHGRNSMTVKLSYDGGITWPVSRLLHDGPAAYSDLCVAADGSILCFYERGDEGSYDRMTVARFDLEWLEGGK